MYDPMLLHNKKEKEKAFSVILKDDGSVAVEELDEEEYDFPETKEFLYMVTMLVEGAEQMVYDIEEDKSEDE